MPLYYLYSLGVLFSNWLETSKRGQESRFSLVYVQKKGLIIQVFDLSRVLSFLTVYILDCINIEDTVRL